MITSETICVVAKNFCEFHLLFNGKTGGWTAEAWSNPIGEEKRIKQRTYEGKSMEECFSLANKDVMENPDIFPLTT